MQLLQVRMAGLALGRSNSPFASFALSRDWSAPCLVAVRSPAFPGRERNLRLDAVGTTKYTYHANEQLLTEDGPWANDTVTLGYNTARLRNSLSLQQPSESWTNGFTYDAARRLASVT